MATRRQHHNSGKEKTMKSKRLLRKTLLIALVGGGSAGLFLSAMQSVDSKSSQISRPLTQIDAPGCSNCVASAAALFAQGDTLGAAALLKSWQTRCPNSSKLYTLLSTILLRTTGHESEAEEAALRATKIAPDSVAAHMQYGLCLNFADKKVEAAHEFEQVVTLAPGVYEAWSCLSTLYRQLHDEGKAKEAEQKVQSLDPSMQTTRTRLLKNLIHTGKAEAASAEVKKLLASQELTAEPAALLAEELLKEGLYPESAQASEKALEQYPQAKGIKKTQALAHFLSNDFAGSLTYAKELLSRDSQDAESQALMALSLFGLGRYTEAVQCAKTASRINPNHELALICQGLNSFLCGAQEAAIKQFSLVQSGEVKTELARLFLARAYREAGQEAECKLELKALESNPTLGTSARALESIMMSEALFGHSLAGKAIQAKDEPSSRQPLTMAFQNPDALAARAFSYYGQGRTDEALALAKEAVAAMPIEIDAQLIIARILMARSDQGAAKQALDAAIQAAPGNARLLNLRSQIM